MTTTIIVLDKKTYGGIEDAVFLDLIDILRALPRKCHGLSWTVFDLWMNYDADDPPKFDEMSKMSESDRGVQMTWEELWAFADLGEQVVEGQFVGDLAEKGPPNVPGRNAPEDTKFEQNCAAFEIVLEAIDSSFWRICSKDAAMIEKLSKKFRDVEEAGAESA